MLKRLIFALIVCWSIVLAYNCFYVNCFDEVKEIENNIQSQQSEVWSYSFEHDHEIKLINRSDEVRIEDKISVTPTVTPKPKAVYKEVYSNSSKVFRITAYDLSVDSCGKTRDHKWFGKTRNGYDLRNQTRESAMTIAADPKIIPLGTKVSIEFIETGYKKYNGIYTVRDTGGGVKGNIIDLFMGDFYMNKEHKSVRDFGITKAYVTIVSQ